MKKLFFYCLFLTVALSVNAQGMETDIFNDLKYKSNSENYNASFKKNIFDDLIFSDNKGNVTTFKKDYLLKHNPDVLRNADAKANLFRQLIRDNRHDENYQITYSIDIMGTERVEDNRSFRSETRTDIFGHTQYKENEQNRTTTVNKELDGTLVYTTQEMNARVKKDIFDVWVYTDSRGHEIKLNARSWHELTHRQGDETTAFLFLIDLFCR